MVNFNNSNMTYACNNLRYGVNLQERLRLLSTRTNFPTRQENGQRYLGPPVDWSGKPPVNSEVFISKLPADCFEDEIYDFCSQAGKIYLLRLMINFENQNRGFCFVTYSEPEEAVAAVNILPQKQLRKGLHIHAEISLNNCTLKMYGLDFRWKDELLEQEIRTNTKDVVNVTIKRNMSQRTLMATLYFDTHQKAAIARRKLSQIANSRWGQNVKVFLWSKKLQNKNLNKQNSCDRDMRYKTTRKTLDMYSCQFERCKDENNNDDDYILGNVKFNSQRNSWSKSPGSTSDCGLLCSPVKSEKSSRPSFSSDENSTSSKTTTYDLNNNALCRTLGDPFAFPSLAQISDTNLSSSTGSSDKSNPFLSSSENDSPGNSKQGMFEADPYANWNTDMFPKPVTSVLELHLPFEYAGENTYTNAHLDQERKIEIILQEALQVLNLNENRI